jgi:hypothetical protein
MFGKILTAIFGGLLVAKLGSIVLGMATASISIELSTIIEVSSYFVLLLISVVIVIKARSVSEAWSVLLLMSTIFSFLLPLSSLILTSNQIVGFTVSTGFTGLFLGLIFLVIRLLINGGNKKDNTNQVEDNL